MLLECIGLRSSLKYIRAPCSYSSYRPRFWILPHDVLWCSRSLRPFATVFRAVWLTNMRRVSALTKQTLRFRTERPCGGWCECTKRRDDCFIRIQSMNRIGRRRFVVIAGVADSSGCNRHIDRCARPLNAESATYTNSINW